MRSNVRNALRALSVVSALTLAASSAGAADIGEISKDDYYGYAYYKQALEHPKVQAQKSEQKRLSMVAKDLGWKPKKLQSVVEKVESLSGTPVALAVEAVKAKVASNQRLKGRVLDVLVNDEEPKHVVMYLRWRGSKSAEAVKEASELAYIVATEAPLISTLSLAAIHPKAADTSKTPVWSGKIDVASAANISPTRIDGYADRLYRRLFEGVEEKPF
jgi:hypothetical protein